MTSRKIDPSIPNVPYPTASRGLVLGADGKLPISVFPPDIIGGGVTPGDLDLKVDKDSVVVAATRLVASKLLAGDAQPAFRILGDGTHSWGPGGATAPDVSLYRLATKYLAADSTFRVIRPLSTDRALETIVVGDAVDARFRATANGDLYWGPGSAALDTNLYRAAAATLKTDGEVFAAAGLRSSAWVMANNGSVANQVFIAADGKIYFGSAGDTNLYRSAAGTLKTDSDMHVAKSLAIQVGTAQQVLFTPVGGNAGIYFGSANDTNLYRSVANTLKTDGTIEMGALRVAPGANQVQIGSDGLMWFSNAFDVNLYRSAASVLKTDGSFRVAQYLDVDNSGGGAQIRFGSAYDTNLYRAGANVLKTDDQFSMPSDLGIFMAASSQPSVWWSGYALGAFVLPGSTASAAQSLRVDVGGTTYKIPLFL